jgi:hypothetical protein
VLAPIQRVFVKRSRLHYYYYTNAPIYPACCYHTVVVKKNIKLGSWRSDFFNACAVQSFMLQLYSGRGLALQMTTAERPSLNAGAGRCLLLLLEKPKRQRSGDYSFLPRAPRPIACG